MTGTAPAARRDYGGRTATQRRAERRQRLMTAALELFGTEEPPSIRRTVAAGPLSVVLEGGGLRGIRFHGVEVLRADALLLLKTKDA